MAIIYTYPLNSIIRGEDMLIGTSTKIVDGYPKNITKNFSVADLTDFVRVNVSLDDVLAVNNVSTRDAKIGSLYLYDTPLLDYGNITLNQNNFVFSTVTNGEVFKVRKGFFRALSSNSTWGNFLFSLLTDNRSWDLPDKDGTFAMLSDIPVVSGFVPTSRTLTINGVTYDLSADRSWVISTPEGEWGSITGNILDQTDLITYLEENYYPLNSNPAGYLTLSSLAGYATESWVGNNFYPLNSNPAGYLTQQEVEEYPSLASFPPTGTIGVIYIALDTGLFYTWNGSAYILSAAPDTGITGGGIVNRLPKFTPDGATIGSSNFSDNGTVGRYTQGSSFVEFITGSNIWLRLQRSTTNRMDFILGNSGIGQPAEITTSNAVGLEFKATGTSGYISLKAGASSLEGIRVLSTGKLQFTQAPDAGTTSDSLLVRDSSGNVKILPYPTIPSTSTLVPYTGATANVDLGTYGLLAEYLEVNTTPTTYTPAVGRLGWNDTDGTIEFKLKGGNVTLQIGQEQVIRVVNKTTPLINLLEANYQVCVVSGATGQRVSVRLAQADSDANSAGTLGVVTETINANQEGFITTSGQVREINTTGSLQGETWNDGDILYLSPTTAGAVTNIKPTAPYHTVIVGYVEYAHAVHGKIYVKIDNGYELDELHNVKITSPTDGQALVYNSILGLWENNNLNANKIANGSVSNTEFQYLDGVTSNIQTQLNNRRSVLFKNTNAATVTSTTSETIIYAEEVLANSIADNTILSFKSRISRGPRVGTCVLKLYINTVNNLSGTPNLIAQVTIAANIGVQPFIRESFFLKNNTLTNLPGSANALTDIVVAPIMGGTTYNINTTYYWILTAQPTTSTDSLFHNFSILERI